MKNYNSKSKYERILSIYSRLMNGEIINKFEESKKYSVTTRSIQRDIDEIRIYLYQNNQSYSNKSVIYDRKQNGYYVDIDQSSGLTNYEMLAVCKILLESRAFVKEEMIPIINKLMSYDVLNMDITLLKNMIANEKYHYIEPNHKKYFITQLWDLGKAIQQHKFIQIEYKKLKENKVVKRKIKPVGIMFSEFYFYLTAYIESIDKDQNENYKKDMFPTIYRIDRINKVKILNESFEVPYINRFEEGEFRKRIQFMYGGELQHIKFKYKGNSIEAILDRLPTAKILSEDNGVYIIIAEVFGKGIDIWIRSQGDDIEVIERR